MTRGSVNTRTPAERSVLEVAPPGPDIMCWFTPPPPLPPQSDPHLQQFNPSDTLWKEVSSQNESFSWSICHLPTYKLNLFLSLCSSDPVNMWTINNTKGSRHPDFFPQVVSEKHTFKQQHSNSSAAYTSIGIKTKCTLSRHEIHIYIYWSCMRWYNNINQIRCS